MSNLKVWLRQRREVYYEGEDLERVCTKFLEMALRSEIRESVAALIVNEPFGLKGNYRQWLLWGEFGLGVARLIGQVAKEYAGATLYATTHDPRICRLLKRFGYEEYRNSGEEYYLVRRSS